MDAIVVEHLPGKLPKCKIYAKNKTGYIDGMYPIGTIVVVSKEYKAGTYNMFKVEATKESVFGMHLSLQVLSLEDMLKRYFNSGMIVSYKEFIRRQGKYAGYHNRKYYFEHLK